MAKQKFMLGCPVRWKHGFETNGDIHHVLAAGDIVCDTGIVIAMRYQYKGTPIERIWYTIRFDEGVFKSPFYAQVYEVDVQEELLKRI